MATTGAGVGNFLAAATPWKERTPALAGEGLHMSMTERVSEHSALRGVLAEAKQHHALILMLFRRVMGTSGVVLATALFLAPLAIDGLGVSRTRLAFLAIAFATVSGLQFHFMWSELLGMVRYKYGVLYPRIYRLLGRPNWVNSLEFNSPRPFLTWKPVFFFNLVALVILVAVWIGELVVPIVRGCVTGEMIVLALLAPVLLGAVTSSAHGTLIVARTMERDIKFSLGRPHHLPLPFASPLCLIPMGDGQRFVLVADLVVHVECNGTKREIVVPRGFDTDLASVPVSLWFLFPPWETYGPAAVVHDYLYSRPEDEWTQEAADLCFLEIMRALGVSPPQRSVIYLAVRRFGASSYRDAKTRRRLDEDEQRRVVERFARGDRDSVF